MPDETQPDFLQQASGERTGLLAEVVAFLRHNKKWWLAPIVISVLLLGLFVVLGGSASPFLYAFF